MGGVGLPDAPERTLAGDRKVVTILFADLSGSTSMQERLDAESTARLMERVQRTLASAVHEHGGRVVKSTGDGVMAVFGVPVLREDDAERAVLAALAMQESFDALAETIRTGHGISVALRVGVNTGEVVVHPDSDDVVGDPVNVAARLEAAAGLGQVLVGPDTARLVRDAAVLEDIEPLTLKGKAEPVAASRVVSAAGRGATATATTFLGRDHDLEALLAGLAEAESAGAARLVTVLAWPGLGKSRLAAELVDRVTDRAAVVDARFVADGGTSFGPVAEALRRTADLPTLVLGPDAERVISTVEALATGGGGGSTEQVFWSIRRALEALATKGPVVVVLDDLHWAEPAMLDLVEHLTEWLRAPVLLLALARPELRELRPRLLEPGGPSATVHILGGLDEESCRRLALDVLDADDLPEGVVARALDASEGNPLFLRELLRLLVDDGVLRREHDRWVLTVEVDAIELPASIHAAIAARIEQLEVDERRVLQAAAVIGRHFARGAVAALVAPSVAVRLDEHLTSLHRRALVDPDATWWDDERMFRFHHVLIRDAAYRRVLKEVRADLHVRYAGWLSARPGEYDEALGHHLEQAITHRRELGESVDPALVNEAVRHLSVAGRRALDGDDLSNAAGLLGRALSLAPGDAGLLRDQAEALVASGDVHAASAVVAELAAAAGDERARAVADVYEAQLAGQRTPDALHDVAERAGAAAEVLAAHGDDVGVAKAEAVRATALAGLGQVAACEAALDRSLAAARRAGDARLANVVLSIAPMAALWGPSPIARASGRCLDVVRVLRITTWAPQVEARALQAQAVLEAMRERGDAARRMLETARKTFTDMGHRSGLLETAMYEGLVELLAGDPAAAEPKLRTAREGFELLGARAAAARATALLARALLELGRMDEAEALADPVLGGDDLKASIGLLSVAAEVSARRGAMPEAVALARRAVTLAAPTDALVDHADARLSLARVLEAAGRQAEAIEERRRARALYEEKEATAAVARADAAALVLATRAPAPTMRRRVARNRAFDLAERWRDAHTTGDLAAIAAFYDPSVVLFNHSLGAGESLAEHLRLHEEQLASGFQLELDPVATLGERHGLWRVGLRWRDEQHGEVERVHLTVWRINDAGRLTRVDRFDPAKLDLAVACLVERWAEGELDDLERERALRTATAWRVDRAIAAGDWDAYDRCFDASVVLRDHRGNGLELVGAEATAQWLRALQDDVEDFETRLVDVPAVTPLAAMWVRRTSGTVDDGGEFVMPTLNAVRFSLTSGLIDRLDFFPADDPAAAWARFEEFDATVGTRPRRRVVPNAASRCLDALVMDGDALHRFEPQVGPRADVSVEMLATLGDRHALAVTRAENESLLVIAVDDAGRAARTDNFPLGELESALACLVERWAADELGGEERERAQRMASAFAALDLRSEDQWSRLVAHAAADVEVVDHRLTGAGVLRGIGNLDAWLRVAWEGADAGGRLEQRIVDVLALEPARCLLDIVSFGDARGTEFRVGMVGALRFDRAGRCNRLELFEADDLDTAWACFDDLDVCEDDAARKHVRRNLALETAEAWTAASAAGDTDAAAALWSHDLVFEDHTLCVLLSREEQLARLFSPPLGTRMVLEPLATEGERHVLVRLRVETDVQNVGVEWEMLAVIRVGDDGRATRIDVFRPEGLAAALACLVERWAEDEAPPAERARAQRRTANLAAVEAAGQGDWVPLFATARRDLVLVDHQPAGAGRIDGVDRVVEWLRSGGPREELSLEVPDVARLHRRGAVLSTVTRGTADGAPFETPLLVAIQLDEFGWMHRLELFLPEDEAAALATFDRFVEDAERTQRRVTPNLATAFADRFVEGFHRRDADGVATLLADDFREVHHALQAEVGSGQHLRELRHFVRHGLGAENEVLASAGERLVLLRIRNRFIDRPSGAEVEWPRLYLHTVDGGGRCSRLDSFPVDAVSDALAMLLERWAEEELVGDRRERVLRTAASLTFDAAAAAGDWDRFVTLFDEGLVIRDHRTTELELRGAAEAAAWIQSLESTTDTHESWLVDVLAFTERAAVVVRDSTGEAAGGPYQLASLNVMRFAARSGRIDRYDFFDLDDLDAAWALFDECDAVAVAPARRIRPNLASEHIHQWLDVLRRRDARALDDLVGTGLQDVPHLLGGVVPPGPYLAEQRQLVVGGDGAEVEVLATLGERHALNRIVARFRQDGVYVERPRLYVHRVDGNARALRVDAFAEPALGDGLATLVRRWAEDELDGWERERALRMAAVFDRIDDAVARRDWAAYSELVEPDLVLRDHRMALELHGVAEIAAWTDPLRDTSETYETHGVDVLALTPRTVMVVRETIGVSDGSPYELRSLNLCRFHAVSGRPDRIDFFDVDDLDRAWAVLDEYDAEPVAPARRVHPNLATGAFERYAAIDATDLPAASALHHQDFVWIDHTWHADMSPAEHRALLAALTSLEPVRTVELVASLGRRHALARQELHWREAQSGEPAEWSALFVGRVDDDGRFLRCDSFDPGALGDALRLLVEEWAEDELEGEERATAERWAATLAQPRLASERAWDELHPLLAPHVVCEDRRPLGMCLEGPAAVVGWIRAFADGTDDFESRFVDVLALTPRSYVAVQRTTGRQHGGASAFERLPLIACRSDDAGRIDWFVVFDEEQTAEAFALVDEWEAERSGREFDRRREVLPHRESGAVGGEVLPTRGNRQVLHGDGARWQTASRRPTQGW